MHFDGTVVQGRDGPGAAGQGEGAERHRGTAAGQRVRQGDRVTVGVPATMRCPSAGAAVPGSVTVRRTQRPRTVPSVPNGVFSRPGWRGSTWQCSVSSRIAVPHPGAEEGGEGRAAVRSGGRVVLQPHPLRALVALPPVAGAVRDDGAPGREGGVSRVQGFPAGGEAPTRKRQGNLVRGTGAAPAGCLLTADGEHVGGSVRPVAALLAVLPPDDQQLAVDVAEGVRTPVVDGAGRPHGVPQQNAFRADDDGPFEGVEDQRGPGSGDTHTSDRRCR